uniref:coiled-coil domain-containing protein 122-like n=1 Tax=Oncorhynchus gorbuscha TaxID=8017 RepID=UPI001EAF0BA7|nr:coiled-coil domain-containing protein 122-like [Oncorhynchus gorbuscha]
MANSAGMTVENDVTGSLPCIAVETHGGPDFSLTQALEDVSQQGYAQIVALREKQQVLSSLQAILSDIEKKGKEAEVELKSNVRQILILEGEMEHLQRHMQDLGLRSVTVYNENTVLRLLIEEEEDNFSRVLAGYNTYRNKMEGHRTAVLQAESQTRAHRELVEKRALVRVLTERREELRADLENPEGNAVKQAQKELDDMRGQISDRRKMVTERRELILKEFESHTLIKKHIEIQNRRYDAIVKRLHCQLMKAQSGHRQLSDDIYHMEREIQDLKRHLEVP